MITLLQYQIKTAWFKPIRQAMFKKKIAKTDLAQQAGITKQSLEKIVTGQMGTRVSTLFALLDALELDLWMVDKDGQSWRLKP